MKAPTDARIKRNQVIQQRISEGRLSDVQALREFRRSPEAHEEIAALRRQLWQADEAMEKELIPEATRDRVIHRLIHGQPPNDPAAETEHIARMRAHGLELQGMSGLSALSCVTNLEEL